VSFSTSTPHAVAAKAAVAAVDLWRAVEAQHVVSTMRLVDSLEEQRVLEDILEATKPPVPTAAARLDYLLFTPFRYPSPFASRFRSVGDPGIFYGAESVRTACAELGYWRWRFLTDSAGLASLGPAQQTLFQASVRTRTVDLERKAFARDAQAWRDPYDYAACQALAHAAREAGVGLIRYASVRDPQPGRCGAVLRPDAFSSRRPTAPAQTWQLTVTRDYATWHRVHDREAYQFDMRVWRKARGKT
jgi:hypothetical protein